MIHVEVNPPVSADDGSLPFVQTVRLADGGRAVGHAVWTTGGDGIAQLVHLSIDPAHRRRGLGRHLYRAVVEQCRTYHRGPMSFRRLWVAVPHKRFVVGRAFLTGEGFHLLTSSAGVYADEDLLVYVRSYD